MVYSEEEIKDMLSHSQRHIPREQWINKVFDKVVERIKLNSGEFKRGIVNEVLIETFPDNTARDIQRKSTAIMTKLKGKFNIETVRTLQHMTVMQRTKEFRSRDYDSYSVLMDRNGYYNNKFYIYVVDEDSVTGVRMVRRKLIGTARHFSKKYFELLELCDFTERVSSRPKSMQGCFEITGKMSWARRRISYDIVSYKMHEATSPQEFKGLTETDPFLAQANGICS